MTTSTERPSLVAVSLIGFALLVTPLSLSATWSVIAIDRATGQVVISSATCVTAEGLRSRGGLKSIQAIIVPGVGVAVAQAGVDFTRENQRLIYRELKAGSAPREILGMLLEDPDIDGSQFGILNLDGEYVGFSGAGNGAASLAAGGRIPGTDIFYGIQGNGLASNDVVHDAAAALMAADGELTDRVMAAMEAADAAGGDARCKCDRGPRINAVCTAKTSHVAYLLAANRGDPEGESFNDGDYFLFIDVDDDNIQPHEDANPVVTLRKRYDEWRARLNGW